VLLFAAGPIAAQERLDLPLAINYAVSQNKALARVRLSIDSGQLREADAAADFKPNILPDFASSRTAGQDAVRYGVRGTTKLDWGTVLNVGVGAVTVKGAGESQTRGSVRFEVQQPIFRNFGSSVAREPLLQAASDLRSARRKYELQKADLVLEVVQTYENILRIGQQVQADRESAKRNDDLYRVTQAREGLGKTTRVDSLRVELLRGQALARLEAGQERLTSAQRDFAELLGVPPDTVFELTPAPALELQVQGSEEAVKIALENRLDYAQAIQDYDDAVRGAILAGRRLTPDMRVTVSYDDFPSTATAFGSVPTGSPLWFVGISSPTDFNITKERIALDQAKVTQTSTSQAIDLIKLSIARQVQQQLEVYRKARAALTIADQNLVIATRRAKLAKSLFEFGRGDNFSVTDAEVAFLQAESQLFSARADTSITAYQLSRVLGKIVDVADDLKPGPEVPAR
jgi:outer membrane protein TolC